MLKNPSISWNSLRVTTPDESNSLIKDRGDVPHSAFSPERVEFLPHCRFKGPENDKCLRAEPSYEEVIRRRQRSLNFIIRGICDVTRDGVSRLRPKNENVYLHPCCAAMIVA